MFPTRLHALSIAALLLGAACTLLLSVEVVRRPQHMTVMNVVWPVSALFGTLDVVRAYFGYREERGETRPPDSLSRRPVRVDPEPAAEPGA